MRIPDPYKTALGSAREAFAKATTRLAEITREEEELAEEITKLRRTITALAAMCSEEPGIDKLGITESVIQVMEKATGTMGTGDVLAGLEELGFDLSSHKNAAASVHSILTRLHLQKKIERIQEEGKSVKWRGPNYDADDDDIPF